MNLRDRARRVFGRELSEHAVRANKIDHAVLHDLQKRASAVQDLVSDPPLDSSGKPVNARVWERLGEDTWTQFYGSDEPSLRASDKLKPEFRLNRELASKNARNETFAETRSMTRGHMEESALGWLGAMRSMHASYEGALQEHAERQSEVADAQDDLESIDDMLAELRQQRNELVGDPDEIDQQIRDLAAQKRRAVQNLQEAIADQNAHAGDMIDASRKAIAKAVEAGQEAVEAAGLLKGTQPGPGTRVGVEQMIEFTQRVQSSHLLQQALEMMGRLDLSMGNTRLQFRKGGYEEMVDIEMGNDLALVLPQEKMLLMHPMGQLDFFRRYTERSLMQYEMWSEQELKRGPFIIGADGSESMAGAPNIFCRGLTLATCMIANREGRNTAAIEFGSLGQLSEFWFPGDRPLDTETALNFAEHFFKGGTDINQVLVRAKDLIDNEAPFHSADLLVITDGQDRLTDQTYEIRDALRDMGVKIHGICVGITPTPYMVEVCDHVSSVFDFAGPNAVSDRIAIDMS